MIKTIWCNFFLPHFPEGNYSAWLLTRQPRYIVHYHACHMKPLSGFLVDLCAPYPGNIVRFTYCTIWVILQNPKIPPRGPEAVCIRMFMLPLCPLLPATDSTWSHTRHSRAVHLCGWEHGITTAIDHSLPLSHASTGEHEECLPLTEKHSIWNIQDAV